MSLKLRVAWRNAGTPLLPDALSAVQALADGTPVPLVRTGPGLREFELPEGAARVELTATFSASFGAVDAAPPMQEEVLNVAQVYEVAGGGAALHPVAMPDYGCAHPLVDTSAVAAERGVVLARIKTDFVDITPFWMAYAANAEEYWREHRPGTELVALGSTGEDPKIWFASVPDACQSPPGDAMSALVFYRPESYVYTRIDQPHDMFGLSRYLLKPDPDPSAAFWARDVFAQDERDKSRWIWLRAGFEQALSASGKAVVLLTPWPSGASFGGATSRRLPDLAEAALRFLWAARKVAGRRGGVERPESAGAGPGLKLGRLALAGFSAGGLALWTALANNGRRVSEVFSFDARGTATNAAAIIRWFNDDASRRLRMTGAYQLVANKAVRKGIVRPGARFTSLPPDEKAYLPGQNPAWDHVCSELDAAERATYLGANWVWHQFSLFGHCATDAESPAATFLERFLRESDL
jgi:hypothetical protein